MSELTVFDQAKQRAKSNIVSRMPFLLRLPVTMAPSSVQCFVLAQSLGFILKEPLADGDLDFLQGRWMQLDVPDIQGRWFMSYEQGRLIVTQTAPHVDVRFSGCLNEFILMMGRKEDPDTLFFQRRLVVEGDTELGLEIKNLLDSLDYDSLPRLVNQAFDLSSDWVANYGQCKA